jgi:hypothetical protein
VYLDYLTWDGGPNVDLLRPEQRGVAWRRGWVEALDQFGTEEIEAYRLIQNNGRGLAIHGTREWTDYAVAATLTPHLAQATGIAARVQGLRRFYALLLGSDGVARLIKVFGNHERVLAEVAYPWELYRAYRLQLQVAASHIAGVIDGHVLFDVKDHDQPLVCGAIALICDEGRVAANDVVVRPAHPPLTTGASS